MPVVTALRATRRGGVALHVDEEYVCVISTSIVARWRLYKGRELDAEDLAQLRAASSRERMMADAYRLLGHRARSREELRRRLVDKDHEEEAVAVVLDALAAEGFLDDTAFAHSYVADKRRLDGWGAERIRRGLAGLGVAADVIDAELEAASGAEDDEVERALALLRRRGVPTEPLDATKRRAYQALLRRGFSSPVAYAAVRRWSSGPPAGPN